MFSECVNNFNWLVLLLHRHSTGWVASGCLVRPCTLRAVHRGGDILSPARVEQMSSRGEINMTRDLMRLNLIILLMTRYGVNSSQPLPRFISDLLKDQWMTQQELRIS